jgi:hypothetical protein
MIDIARSKCARSNFIIGNLLEEPDILESKYHIITCFRFLLNAEPGSRIKVLVELGKRLSADNGILIANIHGHSLSFRYLALLFRRLLYKEYHHHQMSRKEIKEMFREGGFQIIEEYGFGILPPNLYRTPLRKLAKWIDRQSSKILFFTLFSIDLMYVCKKSDLIE